MKFSVITPTFKRPEKLRRALRSVILQQYVDWEMIVVNDNPNDSTREIVESFNDSRIRFFENEMNCGVNSSRNAGLNNMASDSSYVVFLDDDDHFAPEALNIMASTLQKDPTPWLMTARGTSFDNSLTSAPRGSGEYSYAKDYLITKRIKGDATHCISADLINDTVAKLRFPTKIRQAEEWLFYFELGMYSKIKYEQIVTTLTDGYSDTGLNLRKRSIKEQLQTLPLIYKEACARSFDLDIKFLTYFLLRFARALIK